MPQGYGYGNARVRAMRSRLLGPDDYDDLLTKATVEEVITRLAETPYKDDIETALVRYEGARSILAAVRAHLARVLGQMRGFYEGEPAALIDLLLRRWDRHNILAILRGVARGVPSQNILSVSVPVGSIDAVALRELARQSTTRAVIDLMTVWRLPYARALSAARTRSASVADLDALELALNREHFAALRDALAGGDGNRRLVLEQLLIEIDIINIATVLRLARLPEQVPLVHHRYGGSDITPLLIEPGGRVSADRLAGLSDGSTGIDGVVHGLSNTPYRQALEAGWPRYQAGEGLPALERELERWQARERAAMFQKDPLTIAIPIGYLGYLQAQAENLRLIARGVELKMRPESVRREMIIL